MGSWAEAYREMHRQDEAARLEELRKHGGQRRTVTRTVVEVYESVRGEPKTERKVRTTTLSESTETEFFEV